MFEQRGSHAFGAPLFPYQSFFGRDDAVKTTQKLVCLLLALLLSLSLAACGGETAAPAGAPAETPAAEPMPEAQEAPSGGDEVIPDYEDFPDAYVDALPENAADGLTLHAFNWTYREVTDNLEAIRNAGFKNVLLMPVQQPKSGGSAWWAFYQPLGFSIGDASPLGTKEELAELCAEAEKYDICILADIVVNHLATTDDEGKEADGTPMVCPAVEEYEPVVYRNRNEDVDGIGLTFHHDRGAKGSGAETQYYAYGNLPDLNTANPYVQQRILSLLEECIDVGIDGFRFDAAKHIETSADPDYPSDFWENTLELAKTYYTEKTGKELYVYGEILNAPSGRSLSAYTKYMRVTDDGFAAQYKSVFSVKDPEKILNAALKTEDPAQLIAWVESHDEYITASTHYSEQRVAKYWAVIAAKKDLGGLYLARPTEELTVGTVGSWAFESELVAVSNRFHNRFVGAASFESADGSCYVCEKIAENDQGALILNVAEVEPGAAVEVAVPHLDEGNYYDALTGAKAVVSGGIARVSFDGSGLAVLTRSKDTHPQLEISDRGGSFAGGKEITLKAVNSDESYYYFNGREDEKTVFTDTASIRLEEHLDGGAAELTVVVRKGANRFEQSFRYRQLELIEGRFNVVNLPEKYINGEYELYIWSWSPGVWSKNYEIRDGVLLVDTSGMEGFLLAAFEKGYEITDLHSWDSHVLKQSADIKGELLKTGFCDMSGF